MSASVHWHLITGEYPPQPGGVADYSRLIAQGLAQTGARVEVWAPAVDEDLPNEGFPVHRLPDRYSARSLRKLSDELDASPGPRRLLVQYVPHAFGNRGMNLGFCRWLARRPEERWIMFHEVAFPFRWRQPLRHRIIAGAQRLMAFFAGRSASKIFVAIPAWSDLLDHYAPGHVPTIWAPIPSNISIEIDPASVVAIRQRFELSEQTKVVGHFGTYDSSIADPLTELLEPILSVDGRTALLVGRGGEAFADRFRRRRPDLASTVVGCGPLSSEDVAACLSACDLMVQPYPDGVSCRRGSMLAGVALGRPIVTTDGRLTEPLWRESEAVALAEPGDTSGFVAVVDRLLDDEHERGQLGARAAKLYRERFDVSRTIALLLEAEADSRGQAETTPCVS